MTTTKLQDKIRGSIVGGAIGDALGYPVEFIFSFEEIRAKYGEEGIFDYDLNFSRLEDSENHNKALFSDDTQMTLYTAEGLLEAVRSGKPIIQSIRSAYLEWFGCQVHRKIKSAYDSELKEIDELNQQRAPGNTCLSALFSIYEGKHISNNSKGCGGVMRVAPIGLYGVSHGWTLEDTARLAGDAAELTHLHPLSTYSSAALAVIVYLCILERITVDKDTFRSIVDNALTTVTTLYGAEAPSMDKFQNIISKAISLADNEQCDWTIIENELGGGWVAEETLAIAIFSVIRHIKEFTACMKCAVNHGGDSDSTGAVAGNIIGAILGYEAIPDKYLAPLQLHDLLLSMADRLHI